MRRGVHRKSCGKALMYCCEGRHRSSARVNSLAEKKGLKPRALRPGDKIGLLAPASSFSQEAFERGCNRLREMGYEPVVSPEIFILPAAQNDASMNLHYCWLEMILQR